jgi:hypothetical protein
MYNRDKHGAKAKEGERGRVGLGERTSNVVGADARSQMMQHQLRKAGHAVIAANSFTSGLSRAQSRRLGMPLFDSNGLIQIEPEELARWYHVRQEAAQKAHAATKRRRRRAQREGMAAHTDPMPQGSVAIMHLDGGWQYVVVAARRYAFATAAAEIRSEFYDVRPTGVPATRSARPSIPAGPRKLGEEIRGREIPTEHEIPIRLWPRTADVPFTLGDVAWTRGWTRRGCGRRGRRRDRCSPACPARRFTGAPPPSSSAHSPPPPLLPSPAARCGTRWGRAGLSAGRGSFVGLFTGCSPLLLRLR